MGQRVHLPRHRLGKAGADHGGGDPHGAVPGAHAPARGGRGRRPGRHLAPPAHHHGHLQRWIWRRVLISVNDFYLKLLLHCEFNYLSTLDKIPCGEWNWAGHLCS